VSFAQKGYCFQRLSLTLATLQFAQDDGHVASARLGMNASGYMAAPGEIRLVYFPAVNAVLVE